MILLKGDIVGLITISIIFCLIMFLLWHFSFLPIWIKTGSFLWFLFWFSKQIGIVFVA